MHLFIINHNTKLREWEGNYLLSAKSIYEIYENTFFCFTILLRKLQLDREIVTASLDNFREHLERLRVSHTVYYRKNTVMWMHGLT